MISCDYRLENLSEGLCESTRNASKALAAMQKLFPQKPRLERIDCKLPKSMNPRKSVFESFGFDFEKINDPYLYHAFLPPGWTLKILDKSRGRLIDDKGRTRGEVYKPTNYLRDHSFMFLFKRYNVTFRHLNLEALDTSVEVIVIDYDNNIIHRVGECKEICSDRYESLKKEAEAFLDSNYPDWKDPGKYWD